MSSLAQSVNGARWGTTIRDLARDAQWLSAQRVHGYATLFALLFVAMAVAFVLSSQGGVDITGKPLGTDFNSFWTASKLALSEPAATVYDTARHRSAQAWAGLSQETYAAFFYPPVFLLICLPLALLPYGLSLAAWLSVTGAAFAAMLQRASGGRLGLVPLLAFPAVWINIGHGQNAFLSAALLGWGACLLNARPVLAGVCFGALVYKPHLALAVPVALIAARRWETFVAAGCTAVALCLVSLVVLGAETWLGFFQQSAMARAALEQGLVGDAKMQSLFAALRLWGAGLSLSYGLHMLLGCAVCAGLIVLNVRRARSSAEGAALVSAGLLLSPFLLDYDLTILAMPLTWLLIAGMRDGFLPYEKFVLAAAFLLPLVSRTLAQVAGLPLAPFVLLAVFVLILRRGMMGSEPAPGAQPLDHPRPR